MTNLELQVYPTIRRLLPGSYTTTSELCANSNWTEWSTIQGVIAWGRFVIRSAITPWIVRHEVQLLINRNYNKIREEYDSGIDYLTGWYIPLLS